jgi:hypothetical protein
MRRTVQRGIVALAIVASLSVAGASPAAAMDLGLMHQISNLWSFFLGAPSPAPHRTTAGKPDTRKTTSTQPTPDRGWGIDPNGNSITTTDPGTVSNGG